ncbi:Uma2 family endonuclease [Okeania sp. SIO1I7]|uniref:Uma2 family endonuclease n=1 Tax=Okeania sp. SIO1I7 TaxID=2607772 RepID=UPI0034545DDC
MQATQISYSAEEYLEQETTAEFRSEYRGGEIIPMTGGTANHNQIINNFCVALMLVLKSQPYRVYTIDLRLSIPEKTSTPIEM